MVFAIVCTIPSTDYLDFAFQIELVSHLNVKQFIATCYINFSTKIFFFMSDSKTVFKICVVISVNVCLFVYCIFVYSMYYQSTSNFYCCVLHKLFARFSVAYVMVLGMSQNLATCSDMITMCRNYILFRNLLHQCQCGRMTYTLPLIKTTISCDFV